MVDDLVIEEGDLEVLHDYARDMASKLQSVSVVTAGDYVSFGTGGSRLAGLGCNAGGTTDDAIMVVSRDLDDFSQSMNDLINAHSATENGAAVTFQQVAHGSSVMTMDGPRHKMGRQ